MKKTFLLCVLLASASAASASHANKIFMKRPVSTWQNYPAGIKDVELEVTPLGAYAQVDLTFSIGPTSNPPPSDSQEAVIFFDLPANSYVHDSWLWLNPTTVVAAGLMERKKAVEIYTGIVRRRQDPSILLNLLQQGYQLNIYPVTTNVWRKVKITYSTPVLLRNGRGIVPLPTELLAASATPTSFSLKVNTNNRYGSPAFAEHSFGSWLVNQSGLTYQINVPATGYTSSDLNLSFQLSYGSGSLLTTFPTSANEGYYELTTFPNTVATSPRYYNLVIDHQAANETYSLSELRRAVHGWLTTTLSSSDFFNIYYRTGSGITSLFNGWHVADSVGLASIGPAFSGVSGNSDADYVALLKAAMLLTKNTANAETILLNGSVFYTSSANAHIAGIKTALGAFSNKLHVVNYNYTSTTGPYAPSYASAFHTMLFRLSDSTRGLYVSPTTSIYDNYTSSTIYDLNLRDALRAISNAGAAGTSSFQIDLPLNGFTYGEYVTSSKEKFYPQAVYTEIGHYYGSFSTPDSMLVQYKIGSVANSVKSRLISIPGNTVNHKKTWNYFNNRALVAFGNLYRQEVVDSSINNRVLSDYTAFLALETSDTVNKASTLGMPNSTQIKQGVLTAYPNPFKTNLTIESKEPIELVEVFTIDGRLVKTQALKQILRWLWDGKGDNGVAMPAGVYIIRVAGNGHSTAIRVNKLD